MDVVEIVSEKKENDNIFYEIKVNEKKIGYIQIVEKTIMKIDIKQPFRRKGYGTMLMRHVEWIAKISGCKRMDAHAVSDEAKGFFEANSYVLFKDESIKGEYEGYKNILKIH